MELEELVKRAQKGEREALKDLTIHAQQRFDMIMEVHKCNRSDRPDIAQDAMIILLRKLSTLREPKAFNGWIAMILYSAKGRFYGKAWRRKETSLSEIETTDLQLGPEEILQREEKRQLVRMTVEEMSPRIRKVFERFYFCLQSMKEIEKETGVCTGSQKRLLHDGRISFRELYKKAG